MRAGRTRHFVINLQMESSPIGYVIGYVMFPLPRGPFHIIQWASKYARKSVKSSLGEEVYALSEMVDHMSLLRECFAHFTDAPPGVAGIEDCESLFTHLKNANTSAEKFPPRHFPAAQQPLGTQELNNVHWPPGLGNPAGG